VRHFMLESWIITTAGAAVGVVLAVGLSVWLVNTFELPRLDWRYLPAGVVTLWLVGQLAAYVRRDAPPASSRRPRRGASEAMGRRATCVRVDGV